MNKEVFNKKHIIFDTEAKTQQEAFKTIAKVAFEAGYVASSEEFYEGLVQRESETTTGFKDGIAIPHSKHLTVQKPGMFLVKFSNSINWNALDNKPVKVAFALTIPEAGAKEHLKLLSSIARKLIDDEFRNGVCEENDPVKLTEIIEQIQF
ncbi:PTS cellobiose transporter subunit IIA [Bacillus cereus]|nr:PTS cellobiose transporter subunit IIA [Bacillus cereus]PGU65982.1 PTS cellobiose transporter subunit IIA [Bacillus cereus]